ncbi:MAG: PilZ domain-containing protein [Deltaproteobacteria bacterium]|nr:PilZ domain-containing protein [Deltaproteobacteria bacterium]
MKHSQVEFMLVFDSADHFDRTFERKGAETGFFFPSRRDVSLGQEVMIRATIQGFEEPVYLRGVVAWRRVQSGGTKMPAGMYVTLSERDRARLDGIVKYLKMGSKSKERRRHSRLPMLVSARYQTAEGAFGAETRNLSEGGAFLRCRKGPLLTVGARFPVVLYLEGEDGKQTELDVRVAWIDLFDASKGMGVEFESGQPELRRITRALRRFQKLLAS